MYLFPYHPSFLVLTVSYRQSFLAPLFLFTKPFSPLRHITLPLSCAIISRQSCLPILFFSPTSFSFSYYFSSIPSLSFFNNPFFTSRHSFLVRSYSRINHPFLRCYCFSAVISLSSIPTHQSLPSHQSFLSFLFVFTNAAAYLTPPTCPYLAAACRRLLSPSPA
jgi:hypothetical protein